MRDNDADDDVEYVGSKRNFALIRIEERRLVFPTAAIFFSAADTVSGSGPAVHVSVFGGHVRSTCSFAYKLWVFFSPCFAAPTTKYMSWVTHRKNVGDIFAKKHIFCFRNSFAHLEFGDSCQQNVALLRSIIENRVQQAHCAWCWHKWTSEMTIGCALEGLRSPNSVRVISTVYSFIFSIFSLYDGSRRWLQH